MDGLILQPSVPGQHRWKVTQSWVEQEIRLRHILRWNHQVHPMEEDLKELGPSAANSSCGWLSTTDVELQTG